METLAKISTGQLSAPGAVLAKRITVTGNRQVTLLFE
jgi:hypothetical protein